MFLEWTAPLFGTGVDEIDDQHKELFDRVNRLLKACSETRGADEIQPLMKFLGEYIGEHFAFEEQHMDATNCPVAAANKKEHDGFRATYAALCEQVDSADSTDSGVDTIQLLFLLQSTVCDWIVKHILHTDTAMRDSAAG